MKFLIDNNLSPSLSEMLKSNGFDSLHVKETGNQSATDIAIFNLAYEEERIIITADTDFSFLLSRWDQNHLSILLFRFFQYNPKLQFQSILKIVTEYKTELNAGCLIVIEPDRIRIRMLPLL
jgi:predicted nuclease of predicted toxin-antitoxin system